MRILCVHGVGHQEADPQFESTWKNAIKDGLQRWKFAGSWEIQFAAYDREFAQFPLNAATIGEAVVKLGASGLWHSLGDLFPRSRGLADLPEAARWTAGMVVQWAENSRLRDKLCRNLALHVSRFQPEIILAHSLGSLISYDTFARVENAELCRGRVFVSFGSQIGNPFVRSALGGYIRPLPVKCWFHLFNPHDNAFAAPIRLQADNFQQVLTKFDIPGFLDHDAEQYLRHPDTTNTIWRDLSQAPPSRALPARALNRSVMPQAKAERRALLVGIDDYPNEADRLQGCVNDVFLMSSVLQECGFKPENIRVVLNERATAAAIMERLEWLLEDAQDDQHRVFYYSGHGAQIPSSGAGDAVDGLDECLVAHDFNWTRDSAITDDRFFELYSQLPYGAHFLSIFDCCHSGGMTRDGGVRVRGLSPPDDIRHRMLRWNAAEKMWESRKWEEVNRAVIYRRNHAEFFGHTGAKRRLGRAAALRSADREFDRERQRFGHHGPFLPVILQACREDQYSYEYRHGVTSFGAFTYALAQIVRDTRGEHRKLTWEELVARVSRRLAKLRYDQAPDLVCPKSMRARPIPLLSPGRSR